MTALAGVRLRGSCPLAPPALLSLFRFFRRPLFACGPRGVHMSLPRRHCPPFADHADSWTLAAHRFRQFVPESLTRSPIRQARLCLCVRFSSDNHVRLRTFRHLGIAHHEAVNFSPCRSRATSARSGDMPFPPPFSLGTHYSAKRKPLLLSALKQHADPMHARSPVLAIVRQLPRSARHSTGRGHEGQARWPPRLNAVL